MEYKGRLYCVSLLVEAERIPQTPMVFQPGEVRAHRFPGLLDVISRSDLRGPQRIGDHDNGFVGACLDVQRRGVLTGKFLGRPLLEFPDERGDGWVA
jgi:hypothetical protein